ncbi:MAG: retron system putative HNH endonuclease [Dysgonomonas mossii]|uniref:retron system putative HNH endonuclease n=1 Tax=Dysgonomonas mossii TaxID=163665 RepID=UPI003994DC76
MLNLNPLSVIVLSNDELRHIHSINNSWSDGSNPTKNIKNRISIHTLREQSCICAYCERVLCKGEVEIEHIADKGTYRQFTYESLNLVSACRSCNSTANKGTKPSIRTLNAVYRNCVFLIVHPYFDNPDEHLFYSDENKIIYDIDRCTNKGKATINMFNWHEQWAIEFRANQARIRDFNYPIDIEIKIQEISIYKRSS